jgi:hypothetical protein
MRFQDAARDGRAVVYAGIQADPLVARAADLLANTDGRMRVLARAVMNGSRRIARRGSPCSRPSSAPTCETTSAPRHRPILDVALEVAERGDAVRSQVRGAIIEELTARLLAREVPADMIRRERRILFDGVRSEIHPYDVTVERDGSAEAYDCKWGPRGISDDVLYQLDDARTHAADEEASLDVALVVFDARRSCAVRLARSTAPTDGIRIVPLESLDEDGNGAGRANRGRPELPDRLLPRPCRVRFDEAAPERADPDLGAVALHARTWPGFHSCRFAASPDWYGSAGCTWLARAAR